MTPCPTFGALPCDQVDKTPMEAVAWREALDRQCDNMAFLLNHAPIVQQWYDKFTAELAEDRQALAVIPTEGGGND